jgi:hypothetical protein
MAAAVRPDLGVTQPRMLFRGAFLASVDGRPAYDVSTDGARFLMIASSEDQGPPKQLQVVLGWNGRPASPFVVR